MSQLVASPFLFASPFAFRPRFSGPSSAQGAGDKIIDEGILSLTFDLGSSNNAGLLHEVAVRDEKGGGE
jgi:hypothetical protein